MWISGREFLIFLKKRAKEERKIEKKGRGLFLGGWDMVWTTSKKEKKDGKKRDKKRKETARNFGQERNELDDIKSFFFFLSKVKPKETKK